MPARCQHAYAELACSELATWEGVERERRSILLQRATLRSRAVGDLDLHPSRHLWASAPFPLSPPYLTPHAGQHAAQLFPCTMLRHTHAHAHIHNTTQHSQVTMLSSYLVELAQVDASMLHHSYSMQSAAALYVARRCLNTEDAYPYALARHSGYRCVQVLVPSSACRCWFLTVRGGVDSLGSPRGSPECCSVVAVAVPHVAAMHRPLAGMGVSGKRAHVSGELVLACRPMHRLQEREAQPWWLARLPHLLQLPQPHSLPCLQ